MADHQLIASDEREEFAGTSAVASPAPDDRRQGEAPDDRRQAERSPAPDDRWSSERSTRDS
jgi:hypothetical protein